MQDLAHGLSKSEAARRAGVSPSYVTKVLKQQPEAEAVIQEAVAEILDDRQKRWDEFIEQETEDLLAICRDSTELLKKKLKEASENIDGMAISRKEVTLERSAERSGDKDKPADGGGTVKTIMEPRVTLELALRTYKEVHSVFMNIQRGAKPVDPPNVS